MSMPRSLDELFRACTVRISTAKSQGSGFFVAPGLVLTCAHVITPDGSSRLPTVTIHWNQQTYAANIEQIRDKTYPDLALLSVSCRDHPCAYLDEEIEVSDKLYSYGYPDDYPNGDSATFEYEGPTEGQGRLIKLKFGQIRPGLSGAPLLNQRTRRVCGMVKSTRNRDTAQGGRAIPITTVFQEFEQIKIAQHAMRPDSSQWNKSLEDANPTSLAKKKISYFSLLTTFLAFEGRWFQDDFKRGKIYIPESEYFDQLKKILFAKRRALLLGRSAAGKTVLAITFARHLEEHAGYTVCYKDVKQAEMGDGRKWAALMKEHDHPNLLYILDNCHLLPEEVDEFCRQWMDEAPAYTQCLLISRSALADPPAQETDADPQAQETHADPQEQEIDAEEPLYFNMFKDERIQVSPEKIFWQVIEQYATSLSAQDPGYIEALKSDNKEKLDQQHAHNLVILRSYLDAWQTLGATHHLSEIQEPDTYQTLAKKYFSTYGPVLARLCILQRYEILIHNFFIEEQFLQDDVKWREVKRLQEDKLLVPSKHETGYGQLYDLVLHPFEARELFLAYIYKQYGYMMPEYINGIVFSTFESYLKTRPQNFIAVYDSLALHKRENILKQLLTNAALQKITASQFNKENVLDAIRYVYRVAKFAAGQATELINNLLQKASIEVICSKLLKIPFYDTALLLQYIRFIDSKLAQRIVNAISIDQLARQAKEENIQSLFRLLRTLQAIASPEAPSHQALLQAIPIEVLAAKTTIRNLQDTIKQLQKYKYAPDRLKQLIEALDMPQFAQQSANTSLQSLFWALHRIKKVSPEQARLLIQCIPLSILLEKANHSNLGSIDQIVHYMLEFGYNFEQIRAFVEALDTKQVAHRAKQGNLRRLTALLRTLKAISPASALKLLETFTPVDIAELLQDSSLKASGDFLQDQYANRNVREGYALFQKQTLQHQLAIKPLDEINEFLDHLSRIRRAGPQLVQHALNLLMATDITDRLTQTNLDQYVQLLRHARSIEKAHIPQLLAPLHHPDILQTNLAKSSLHTIQLLILNVAHMDINYLPPIQQTLPTINITEKFAEASLRDIGHFLWNVYISLDKQMAQEYSLQVDRHVQIQRLTETPPEDACFLFWNLASISNASSLQLFDEPIIHRLLQIWHQEAGWSAVLLGIAAMVQDPLHYSKHSIAIRLPTEALHYWFTTNNGGRNPYFLALALQGLRAYDESLAHAVVRNIFQQSHIRDRLQSAKSSAITSRSITLIEGTLLWLEQLLGETQ